jgi:hypothetical protein
MDFNCNNFFDSIGEDISQVNSSNLEIDDISFNFFFQKI